MLAEAVQVRVRLTLDGDDVHTPTMEAEWEILDAEGAIVLAGKSGPEDEIAGAEALDDALDLVDDDLKPENLKVVRDDSKWGSGEWHEFAIS